ncbi:CRAL/TRIO domain protein [Paecilomyces variotii No. 5]|uniref:CRAL/TRIO domain protein n=1 Tax=Byssochlamys spectabilis (strain No. 5 / NBRC 109023) TaxID=1356009 RepID=V5F9W3_BYSSN|nr:CRAL/TRIO domain protein [Paecilomyces variotii No. 5]
MRACSLGRLAVPFPERFQAFSLRSSARFVRLPLYRPSDIGANFPRNLTRSISTQSHLRSPDFNRPRQASSFWTITFALLTIGGGLVKDIYSKSAMASQSTQQPDQTLPPQRQDFLGVIDTLKMATDEIPPGCVGNLTPEQEKKLQEFWVMVLKVCGVKVPEELDRRASVSSAAPPSPTQPKKTKRRSFFWGKGAEEDTADDTASVASGVSGIKLDGDDKYGQNKEFQQALSEIKPEELRLALWSMTKQDNPDSLLLRFLRARKWDLTKALVMLVSTLRWRLKEMHVDDDITKNGEANALLKSQSSDPTEKKEGEDFMRQLRTGKSFAHGIDRNGRPMCYVRVRLHRGSEQSAETMERFTVLLIETTRMMLTPPVETAAIVFDMTDFTLANMDYHPVKFIIKCFEANYPECLGTILIHKAPWIFSGIWKIIRGWLDPVVAAKVNFTNSVQDLEQFIPRDRIIKELGGDEDWEYKYIEPVAGENDRMKDTATRDKLIAKRQELADEVQAATLSWVAAGKAGNKDLENAEKAKRDSLIHRLREEYWELDPYVRARTVMDRAGNLIEGGKVQFYPERNASSNTSINGASTSGGSTIAEEKAAAISASGVPNGTAIAA